MLSSHFLPLFCFPPIITCVCWSLNCVQLFASPWTVAHQAPLSMEFSRQECWSGLPFPSPGALPNPGIEPGSPAVQANSLSSKPPQNPLSHMDPISFNQLNWGIKKRWHYRVGGWNKRGKINSECSCLLWLLIIMFSSYCRGDFFLLDFLTYFVYFLKKAKGNSKRTFNIVLNT